MKLVLPLLGLGLGVAIGWLAFDLAGLHWFIAVLVGFGVLVAFTRSSEHYVRATAERRAIKAFEHAKRRRLAGSR